MRGINVIGPMDHGFCKSIYFAGPEDLALEVSTYKGELTPDRWVDPEVMAFTGVTPEDLKRFVAPAPHAGQGGAVPQPAYDPAKPHPHFPEDMYQNILSTPDALFTEVTRLHRGDDAARTDRGRLDPAAEMDSATVPRRDGHERHRCRPDIPVRAGDLFRLQG